MSKIVRLGLVLFIITAVTGLILGGVYTITLEPIRATELREKNEALASTLPGAKDFKPIPLKADAGIVKDAYEGTADGKLVGYNFTVMPKGYGGLITLVVGMKPDGQVTDIKILAHTETPGLGAKAADAAFTDQFQSKKADELTVTKTHANAENQIQAISGATITSRAVVSGVNAATNYLKKNMQGAPGAEQNGGAVKETTSSDAVSSASQKGE